MTSHERNLAAAFAITVLLGAVIIPTCSAPGTHLLDVVSCAAWKVGALALAGRIALYRLGK